MWYDSTRQISKSNQLRDYEFIKNVFEKHFVDFI